MCIRLQKNKRVIVYELLRRPEYFRLKPTFKMSTGLILTDSVIPFPQ